MKIIIARSTETTPIMQDWGRAYSEDEVDRAKTYCEMSNLRRIAEGLPGRYSVVIDRI